MSKTSHFSARSQLVRLARLGVGVVALVGALSVRAITTTSAGFTPFVSQSLPQVARGDFDGDGRSDVAVIRDAVHSKISITLSGSLDALQLEGTAAGLASVIEGDVDHDGDLDLVAASSSGDVLIWLNDGRGHFTRQKAPARGWSDGPVLIETSRAEFVAVGTTAPSIDPKNVAGAPVAITEVRRSAAPVAFTLRFLTVPALRAPPSPV
jgi:hypothetical protein